jgi:hypothetical protein
MVSLGELVLDAAPGEQQERDDSASANGRIDTDGGHEPPITTSTILRIYTGRPERRTPNISEACLTPACAAALSGCRFAEPG